VADVRVAFAAWLRELRLGRNLTLEQFAKRADSRSNGSRRWRGSPDLAPEKPKKNPNANFRPSGCG
jgi:transcriptional regulator with XRE-family HTH domain